MSNTKANFFADLAKLALQYQAIESHDTEAVVEAPVEAKPSKARKATTKKAPAKPAVKKAPVEAPVAEAKPEPMNEVLRCKNIIKAMDDKALVNLIKDCPQAFVSFFRNGAKKGYRNQIDDLFLDLCSSEQVLSNKALWK